MKRTFQAVCCDDHEHCCPKGFICDLHAGTCHNEEETMVTPWLDKFHAQISNDEDVICKGGKFKCPGKSTCCELAKEGEFGCCPLLNVIRHSYINDTNN